jgi:hypothetical protein
MLHIINTLEALVKKSRRDDMARIQMMLHLLNLNQPPIKKKMSLSAIHLLAKTIKSSPQATL